MGKNFSTEQLAELLKVKPSTIRRGLCIDGHYLNLRPLRLSNRRLLWPAEPVEKLLSGGEV